MPKKKTELSNEVKSLNPQCKVVLYPWKLSTSRILDSELGYDTILRGVNDSSLAETSSLDISSQIINFNYVKTMDAPCGTFNFSLANGEKSVGDWKQIIQRGTWVVIYLAQDGSLNIRSEVGPARRIEGEQKYVRCVGYVDRVSVASSMADSGAYDVTFNVSGRDFGVVYEDTTIWHNLFQFDEIILKSLTDASLNVMGTTSLTEVIKTIHNLFFNPEGLPGAKVNDNKSLTSIALQWLLPSKLISDLGMRNHYNDSYWGRLNTLRLSETKATLSVEHPTSFLTGNAWEQLKRLSSPAFHELFTELDDEGHPTLVFRPIPFGMNKSKYPLVGKHITLYKNLEALDLKAIDVVEFDLGEDGHSRYNSFLATVETSLISPEDNISYLSGQGFPKFVQSSIKRHGFRPMHVTADNIVKDALNAVGSGTPVLLKEFNEVLMDYWAYAAQAESGYFNLVGRNDIKVGKCLLTSKDVPYAGGKRFYIEGYTDSFTVEESGAATWMQQVEVTRGFSEDALKNPARLSSKFQYRDEPVKTSGEFTKKGGK